MKAPLYDSVLSVTLSLGNSSYQERLPRVLRDVGSSCRIFRFSPYLSVDDIDPGEIRAVRRFPAYSAARRAAFFLRNKIPRASSFDLPQRLLAASADRLVAPYVIGDVFHGITSSCLTCLHAARRGGTRTLVERTGQHPQLWNRDVLAECRRFDVRPSSVSLFSDRMACRMQREYEMADCIAVCSAHARDGFSEFVPASKVIVIHPGIDARAFTPAPRPPAIFRVLYAGRVELAKGIPYLIEAWRRLNLANAELVLAGDVQSHIRGLLAGYSPGSIRCVGQVRAEDMPELYRRASLVVLPSFNEGLARTILEGMAAAVPVIATDASGACDCLVDSTSGFIVSARDIDALCDPILWCYRHPDEARAIGSRARAEFLKRFTIEHYEQRQLAAYRSLAGVNAAAQRPESDRRSSARIRGRVSGDRML